MWVSRYALASSISPIRHSTPAMEASTGITVTFSSSGTTLRSSSGWPPQMIRIRRAPINASPLCGTECARGPTPCRRAARRAGRSPHASPPRGSRGRRAPAGRRGAARRVACSRAWAASSSISSIRPSSEAALACRVRAVESPTPAPSSRASSAASAFVSNRSLAVPGTPDPERHGEQRPQQQVRVVEPPRHRDRLDAQRLPLEMGRGVVDLAGQAHHRATPGNAVLGRQLLQRGAQRRHHHARRRVRSCPPATARWCSAG